MFRHLLKLMWNKRRANSMIFLEILLAFVVLFGVFAFVFYNMDRYRSPLGFNYEQTIGIRMDFDDELDSLAVIELQNRIHREMIAMPNVEAASFIGPVNPFGGNTWQTGTEVNGQQIRTQMLFADYRFGETAEVTMTDGHWFTEDDMKGKYIPTVVNAEFKRRYFPDVESIVDSVFDINGEHIVVGVTGDFKYKSNFAENFPLTFYPQMERLGEGDPYEMMVVRLRPNTMAETEEDIFNLLVDNTKNTEVVIWSMAKDRNKANRPVMIPMVILLVISGFLLINIALGLFGVLFTQINRRRAEIGLRKAMGATSGQVTLQFVLEILIVTVMALLLGAFFAVQVPLLELTPIPGKFFYYGILAAVTIIAVIVLLCSFLPSRQAAGMHPANVLHEE
ncbi:FtsX-like permease family protein [Neolewinella aurantiaca]|uniref:FtsX-like permease family protein n=1 Tax=Neolewinella aurantiaca TaxID=2602767 RepID=A0A5C7FKM2_9BACT|nr:FtsX-like permease family protein [Neolewinella aurantiaca]TXF90545.1 FtsX-like permease family protein [Neolewinella aurantiaca]